MDISIKNTREAAYTAQQTSARQITATAAQKESSIRTDRLDITARREAAQDAFSPYAAQLEQARTDSAQQVKQTQEEAKAQADAAKVRLLCFKIAMRILAGDKVPPEDEKYLLDNDPELYTVAISARRQKEDPEEYESLLEDDEEEGNNAADSLSGLSPTVSASPEAAVARATEAAPVEVSLE